MGSDRHVHTETLRFHTVKTRSTNRGLLSEGDTPADMATQRIEHIRFTLQGNSFAIERGPVVHAAS